MSSYIINGGKKLNGKVVISGAKNSAVALLPATLLCSDICILKNIPDINDIHGQVLLLESLGAKVSYLDKHTLKIDTCKAKTHILENEEAKTLRASYYFLGALLGRYKKASIPIPGGCDFGKRPVDYHINGFNALGYDCKVLGDKIIAEEKNAKGTAIRLPVASVGATINILLASVLTPGETVINNSAKEPHIIDICNFLVKMGANINGIGTSTLTITGVTKLHGCTHTCISDQIEAGTFLALESITCGKIELENADEKDLAIIREAINTKDDSVSTGPYPLFPTDMHPQLAAVMLMKNKSFKITEGIWEDRFRYISEMNKFGANIKKDKNSAIILPDSQFKANRVFATDLRAGASLIILALGIKGTSIIDDVYHVERGYEDFVGKLLKLGADIRRTK